MRSTILIPLSGAGSRFPREVWHLPKPLLLIDDKSIIEWSMSCIDYSGCDIIFVVRQADVDEFSIDSYLKEKFGAKVIVIQEPTRGAAETCLAAEKYINPDQPLIIHCSDVIWEPKFSAADFSCQDDGCILTFKSNSPNYSYSQINTEGFVIKVAEKKVISNNASVGIYWFKRGKDFISAAKCAVRAYDGKEIHVCPIYQLLIDDGKKISTIEVDKMHVVGTPEEMDFFVKNSLRTFPHRKKSVVLASDHSGFAAKQIFKTLLDAKGVKYIDVGCFNDRPTDYSEYIKAAAKTILEEKADFGFGFCRSGQGVNIAANKIKGIRSAWVNNEWLASMAVKHNCANFFAISEYLNDEKSLSEILDAWLLNTFDGGRHQTRLMKNEN